MADMMILDQEIELKPEHLDKYVEAAASVVEELRDFLSAHYLDLTKPPMTKGAHGFHGELPAAADDPGYAANIHRLKVACDNFINAMRGNW
jgi:hypothetical protein